MFSRGVAVLAATLLLVGLIAPASTLAVDPSPICDPATFTPDEDTTLNASVSCTVTDPVDHYTVDNDVNHGTLHLANDGTFSYTPAADFNGLDSFAYHVTDAVGDSNTATITIDVQPVNDPPTTGTLSYSTPEDVALHVAANVGLLSNASDVDGDPMTASLVAPAAAHGSVTGLGGDGHFTYTPDANFHGTDTFGYRVSDGNGGHDDSTVTITISSVNDAPACTNGSSPTSEDTPVTDSVDCSDIDGDTLTYSVSGNPSHGSVHFNGGTSSFTYTPSAGYSGSDSFGFTADDGNLTDVGTQTITITSVNHPPSATGDSAPTLEDTQLVVAAPGVLANDSDPDGDSLTAVLVADVGHGTLNLSSNGRYTYSPDANYNGPDSFTYRAKDPSNATSSVVTVALTVTPVNDEPSFTPGSDVNVLEGASTHTVAGWATGSTREHPTNHPGSELHR